MKKFLNLLLLLTSLIGYLEWGGGNKAFLFQSEYHLLFRAGNASDNFTHPFVLVPLLGQLLLLFTLFQKVPSRALTYIAMACLGLLLVFIFFIGLMAMNWKMALSALPFIIVSIITIRNSRRDKIVAA